MDKGRKLNGLRYDRVTCEEIIHAHEVVITEGGGTHGLLNQGNLEHIVTYLKEKEFSGNRDEQIISRAAYLLHSIITKHPFIDGHKRTGFIVAGAFLLQNGLRLTVDYKEAETFLKKVASYNQTVFEVEKWLSKRVSKI